MRVWREIDHTEQCWRLDIRPGSHVECSTVAYVLRQRTWARCFYTAQVANLLFGLSVCKTNVDGRMLVVYPILVHSRDGCHCCHRGHTRMCSLWFCPPQASWELIDEKLEKWVTVCRDACSLSYGHMWMD